MGAYFSLAPFISAVITIPLLYEVLTPQLAGAGTLIDFRPLDAPGRRHCHPIHKGPVTEPDSHWHRHETKRHRHDHDPDMHHLHGHE